MPSTYRGGNSSIEDGQARWMDTDVITVRTGSRPGGRGHHWRRRPVSVSLDGVMDCCTSSCRTPLPAWRSSRPARAPTSDLLPGARRPAAGRRAGGGTGTARRAHGRGPRHARVRRAVRDPAGDRRPDRSSAPGSRSAWSTPTATTRPGRFASRSWPGDTPVGIMAAVTTPQELDERFRTVVGSLTAAERSQAIRRRRIRADSHAHRGTRHCASSMPSSPAGT